MPESYTFAQIDRVCARVEEKMRAAQYDSETIRRYGILVEEALIKWREALGEGTALAVAVTEKKGWMHFQLSAPGEKTYPFENGSEEKDYIGRMHDRLLSGTGSEVGYRYADGENRLSLALPVKDHERSLFYHNAVSLAVPAAIQALLTTLITMTDSLLLGFLNQNALSAISLAAKYIGLFNMAVSVLVTGTTIFASQCWGKRDWKGLSRVFSISVKISAVFSLVCFCGAFFAPRFVMGLYTNVPELIDMGEEYLRIVSVTFLFSAFFQIYYGIMRNTGRIVRCTVYQIGSAAFNCLLDFLLIFGLLGFPQIGIRGAAIGSVAAAVLQFALCMIDLKRSSSLSFLLREDDHAARQMIVTYFRQSLPLVLQIVSWNIADNIIASIIGHMDSNIIAAVGVANTAAELGFFICSGVFGTCGILIGNKLGKGELEMAKTYSHRYLGMIGKCAAITFVITFITNGVIGLLPLTLTAEAFRILHILLLFSAFTLVFRAFNNTFSYGGFYAGGDTVALAVIDIICMWGIMVPFGLLGTYVFHLPPMLMLLFLRANEIVSFPLKLYRYKQYRWLKQLPTQ